jgi:hypothetical protein
MKFWILKIAMVHGITEYGYKFLEKKNCEKVGADIVKQIRRGAFTCKLRNI